MEVYTIYIIAALAAVALAYRRLHFGDRGRGRLFEDQSYNFQTLRALNDIPFDGADTGEVLQTISKIKAGDAQGWYAAWGETGERLLELAKRTRDPIQRGHALLRAHNYFRTAEFFLPPDDPKRKQSFKKNTAAFYEGLRTLGVEYERIEVPYGANHLTAIYYPGPTGAGRLPLIILVGGFDSTLEELYFMLVSAAYKHGYSVLTYEGPGQGSVIRDQGLPLTHEWEKPTTAVIDAFLSSHPTSDKMVLVGMSLGGYLAPRAAAFESRIDGVVSFDVVYDVQAAVSHSAPRTVFWLYDNGFRWVVDIFLKVKAAMNPGFRWSIQNGMWVMNTSNPIETARAFDNFKLAPVADRIKGDVLILAGVDDHFVPPEQADEFRAALVNARSVTTAVYDRASGGSEHCQLGAATLWHATFFDWLQEKFPARRG